MIYLPHLPLVSNDEGGICLQGVSSNVNVCLCADTDRFFCSSDDGVAEVIIVVMVEALFPPFLIRGHYPFGHILLLILNSWYNQIIPSRLKGLSHLVINLFCFHFYSLSDTICVKNTSLKFTICNESHPILPILFPHPVLCPPPTPIPWVILGTFPIS